MSKETLRSGGRLRHYSTYLPATVSPHTPVIVVLHLFQEEANGNHKFSTFQTMAVRRGAIVVIPLGYRFSWNAGACCGDAATRKIDDVGFLEQVLSATANRFGAKRSTFLVGFSNGGFMALRLACEGVRVAGVAVVEATLGVADCRPANTDMIQIHQTGDPIVPFSGTDHPIVPGSTRFPSVADTFARWRAAEGCDASGKLVKTGKVTKQTFPCPNGTRAELVAIRGGGHDWPTRPPDPVDAGRLILRFFGI